MEARRRVPLLYSLALFCALVAAALAVLAVLAQSADGTLVVDDAAAANPDLVPTQLQVPAGFDVQPRTVYLPPGFSISVLAAGLERPRFMAFDPSGNLLVADARAGRVYRYPALAGGLQPAPAPPTALLSELEAPTSLAFLARPDVTWLYVGETSRVTRFGYGPDGPAGGRQVVVPDLPVGGHNTRTVVFGPDGRLYLSVGSSCNLCDEDDERRAAVLRYDPDGGSYERFAWGLRNAVGLAFQPGADLLWATVNERDRQGNETPPDLVTIVEQGANYGWPDCLPQAGRPQQDGADCSGVATPTVGIQAHSAPLGLTFYEGGVFPAQFQGDLFVAQHGSWNRQPPAAPKLLRIDFQDGQPVTARDFATGWQLGDDSRWGRPAGVLAAPDGSLIVSDDQAGLLYRISYGG